MRTSSRTADSHAARRKEAKSETVSWNSVEAFDNFIWALAGKFTASADERLAAAKEIYIDIGSYAKPNVDNTAEHLLSSLIARRRLVRYLRR